jgi:hypothetical protein
LGNENSRGFFQAPHIPVIICYSKKLAFEGFMSRGGQIVLIYSTLLSPVLFCILPFVITLLSIQLTEKQVDQLSRLEARPATKRLVSFGYMSEVEITIRPAVSQIAQSAGFSRIGSNVLDLLDAEWQESYFTTIGAEVQITRWSDSYIGGRIEDHFRHQYATTV